MPPRLSAPSRAHAVGTAASTPVEVGIVLREQDLGAVGRLARTRRTLRSGGRRSPDGGRPRRFADGPRGWTDPGSWAPGRPPDVRVQTGVYLLALRHPAIVALQLPQSRSSRRAISPSGRSRRRDPSEYQLCGIDPRERGARTTEGLRCVRQFMSGDEVAFGGASSRSAAPSVRRRRCPSRFSRPVRRARTDGTAGGRLVRPLGLATSLRGGDRPHRRRRRAGRASRCALAPRASALDRVRRIERASEAATRRGSRRPTGCRSNASSATRRVVPLRWWLRRSRHISPGCRRFNFVAEAASLPAAMDAAAEVKALCRRTPDSGARGSPPAAQTPWRQAAAGVMRS